MASKMSKEFQELWVAFAHDAMSRYEVPDGKLDNDDLVDDMVEISTKYADSMLDELEKRLAGGSRKRRRKDADEDEDEDEDEDDEE